MNTINLISNYSIRGLNICGFYNKTELVNYLFANGNLKQGKLIAINAEKILMIEKNNKLRDFINTAEYKYADGISIIRSIQYKYPDSNINRIAGIDLWEAIMKRAGKENIPVFLIGGHQKVLQETKNKLRKLWNVKIVDCQDGYFDVNMESQLIDRIRKSRAAIITVGMGSPRQEWLIQSCWKQYKKALYMGVGGTYDIFSGYIKRAPKIWQDLSIEWLYRLIITPSRLRRQLKLLRYLGYYISRNI